MNQEPKLQALSVEYKVAFGNGSRKAKGEKKPAAPKPPTNKLPRITRLLTLAHHLQDLMDQGIVQDYADIARLSGLTRARVSQIMNLTLLAPQIQEELLFATPGEVLSTHSKEYAVRMALKTPVWEEQINVWETVIDCPVSFF